ncbi:unnamed protein product [Anisakis simplex]|uniref:Kinesin motor domain-containing protein n=1 Tax=Anisakis simplex TaxID=6269 RepID=A0A0M3J8L7_ANISI|nr:unnamed protein product [Anisakis simplex]
MKDQGGTTTVINQDKTLYEAIKRFNVDTTAAQPLATGGQFGISTTAADDELHKEIMKKYEESVERILELESRGDGNASKVLDLEDELKRTKDRLSECLDALRKIHMVSKEPVPVEGSSERSSGAQSPASLAQVAPPEVLRSVRQALRNRDNELQLMQRKMKNTESQVNDLEIQLNSAEETRKRLEKQLLDTKKELTAQLVLEFFENFH